MSHHFSRHLFLTVPSLVYGCRSVDCLAVFERDVVAHTEQHLHHRVYTIDSCHISPVQSGKPPSFPFVLSVVSPPYHLPATLYATTITIVLYT